MKRNTKYCVMMIETIVPVLLLQNLVDLKLKIYLLLIK